MMPKDVAPPLEWHPYYARMTHLVDWLNETGPLKDRWAILIPIYPPVPAAYWHQTDEKISVPLEARSIVMNRYRAWGDAPYVGRPFVYTWNVGVDSYGRQIAGESKIHYLPEERTRKR